jgi:hypothetical protein
MKRRIYFLAIGVFAIIFSSCTINYYPASTYDDVYYSRKDAVTQTAPSAPVVEEVIVPDNNYSENQYSNNNYSDNYYVEDNKSQPYSESSSYTDDNGTTYVTNNYYGDYYDYEYTSRLRRFYGNYTGFDYYDPYYTNLYWYTYDPFYYGVSIYYTYSWWYRPYRYSYYGWGWHYPYYHYCGWGYPYYGYI